MMQSRFISSGMEGVVDIKIDTTDSSAKITIDGQWFTPSDIEELRKFLKKLQRQLEADGSTEGL